MSLSKEQRQFLYGLTLARGKYHCLSASEHGSPEIEKLFTEGFVTGWMTQGFPVCGITSTGRAALNAKEANDECKTV